MDLYRCCQIGLCFAAAAGAVGITVLLNTNSGAAEQKKSAVGAEYGPAVGVPSSVDDREQSVRLYVPNGAGPRPMLVFLHSWSGDYTQDNSDWLKLAQERGWIFLHPDFRGPNRRPEACGSLLARQDILDAISYVLGRYEVDTNRIYLAGSSGGGHMAMLMAGHHPDRFSAVSAWAGISDLKAWWEFTRSSRRFRQYSRDIEAVLGGRPGESERIDEELRVRSPVFHLKRAREVPLDINAGVFDGRTGSVPITQSIMAFNAILRGREEAPIDAESLLAALRIDADRRQAEPVTTEQDPSYGRRIYYRRTAGASRLTLFHGGHEDVPRAGVQYLEKIRRPTAWSSGPGGSQ